MNTRTMRFGVTRPSGFGVWKEKGTGYCDLVRRPRGRSVDWSPHGVASGCCHSVVPNGC